MDNSQASGPAAIKFVAKIAALSCLVGLSSVGILGWAFDSNPDQRIQAEPAIVATATPIQDQPALANVEPEDTASLADHAKDAPEDQATENAIEVVIVDQETDDAPVAMIGVCAQRVAFGGICRSECVTGRDRCTIHLGFATPIPQEAWTKAVPRVNRAESIPEEARAEMVQDEARTEPASKTPDIPSGRASSKERKRSKAEKLAIWRELYAADDRAIWEADRLHDPVADFEARLSEYERRVKRYTDAVLRKHGMSKGDRSQLEVEAIRGKWPEPSTNSFDKKAAARGLRIRVYAVRGSFTYHRRTCWHVEGEPEVTSALLHEALAVRGSRACPDCKP